MEQSYQYNTNAIISLIMGVLSLIFFPLIGWVFGIIGIIYAGKSLRELKETRDKGQNLAEIGRVCSIIGLALSLLTVIVAIAGLVFFSYQLTTM